MVLVLSVGDGLSLPDCVPVPVEVAVGLEEEVPVVNAEGGREEVGVWEGEAPTEREAVGPRVGLELLVGVGLGVSVNV